MTNTGIAATSQDVATTTMYMITTIICADDAQNPMRARGKASINEARAAINTYRAADVIVRERGGIEVPVAVIAIAQTGRREDVGDESEGAVTTGKQNGEEPQTGDGDGDLSMLAILPMDDGARISGSVGRRCGERKTQSPCRLPSSRTTS